jgi:hypothetical protein
MRVDLSRGEAGGWARIWGTLLNSALFVPLTQGMVEAADEVAISPKRLNRSLLKDGEESREARWWRESLADSENFQRDLSASITANSSAILMLLRTPKLSKALENFRNYGSTIFHTTINAGAGREAQCHVEPAPLKANSRKQLGVPRLDRSSNRFKDGAKMVAVRVDM